MQSSLISNTFPFFSSSHVNGLVACLYEYLNLSPENVCFQKVRQKYMQVFLV